MVFSSNPANVHVVEHDPGDDQFAGGAIALDAEYIITGDKHLLDLKSYMGIFCISPADFLEKFSSV